MTLGLIGGCIAIFQFLVSDSVSAPWFRSIVADPDIPGWFAALGRWAIETHGSLPLWVTIPGMLALWWLAGFVAAEIVDGWWTNWQTFVCAGLYLILLVTMWSSVPVWIFIVATASAIAFAWYGSRGV